MAKSSDASTERADALTTVREARARFDDADQRALAAGAPPPAGFVDAIRRDFDAIESELASANPDAFEALTDRADRLSRQRAYLYPIEEIELEGRSLFADLSQWGVPTAILTEIQNDSLKPLSGPDQRKARGALRTLYDAYDYWGWYVDWYADFMRIVAGWLIALEAVALLVMVNRFVCGDIILGFVSAGVAGALVSVISRMPPLIADAESNAYIRRILMRVGTGTAAALIGGGFLASGLLNVALPNDRVTITELIEVCGRQGSCWPFSWWQDTATLAGPGKPTLPPEGRQPAPDRALTPPPQAAQPQAVPPAGSPGVGTQTKTATVTVKCSTGGILLLMALGLLLGFSERALTTFEERLFTGSPSAGAAGGGSPPRQQGGGGQGGPGPAGGQGGPGPAQGQSGAGPAGGQGGARPAQGQGGASRTGELTV